MCYTFCWNLLDLILDYNGRSFKTTTISLDLYYSKAWTYFILDASLRNSILSLYVACSFTVWKYIINQWLLGFQLNYTLNSTVPNLLKIENYLWRPNTNNKSYPKKHSRLNFKNSRVFLGGYLDCHFYLPSFTIQVPSNPFIHHTKWPLTQFTDELNLVTLHLPLIRIVICNQFMCM